MTIDEAIAKHTQIADSYKDTVPDCDVAQEHRQLAEWLTELKELRNAVKILCVREGEYKRLLKAALDDMNAEEDCGICLHDREVNCPIAKGNCAFEWTYAAEALALIGEDINVTAREDGE